MKLMPELWLAAAVTRTGELTVAPLEGEQIFTPVVEMLQVELVGVVRKNSRRSVKPVHTRASRDWVAHPSLSTVTVCVLGAEADSE
jgi:hypothetical protein